MTKILISLILCNQYVIILSYCDIFKNKIIFRRKYIIMKILKRILPDVVISEVSEFDDAKIKKLKEKFHIQGMVLDVDETIRFNI